LSAVGTSNNALWFVTEDGALVKRDPTADSWQIVSQVKVSDARFIAFLNDQIGYLVGNIMTRENSGCEIFKTTDGGKTWNKVFESKLSGGSTGLSILDENNVLVAMNNEYLLRTKDGGKDWVPIGFDGPINGFNNIVARDVSGASDFAISPD